MGTQHRLYLLEAPRAVSQNGDPMKEEKEIVPGKCPLLILLLESLPASSPAFAFPEPTSKKVLDPAKDLLLSESSDLAHSLGPTGPAIAYWIRDVAAVKPFQHCPDAWHVFVSPSAVIATATWR